MNKKKLITALASVTLVAAIGIGATLAYFTDSEGVGNILTMGKVDISLTEESADGTPLEEGGLLFEDLVPGDVVEKIPTISLNSGSSDAYIRVRLTFDMSEEFRKANMDADSLYTLLDINTEDWARVETTESNDSGTAFPVVYYYYQTPLSLEGNSSVDFFSSVSIPKEWGNALADGTFSIHMRAEAIQADNIVEDLILDNGRIVGWPDATIEKYLPVADRPDQSQ